MGLKNSAGVIKLLQEAAPKAWHSEVLPEVGYTAFVVDLLSLLRSLVNGCRTGGDILRRIKLMVGQHRLCATHNGKSPALITSVFVIDDYEKTPPNKQIERDLRQTKSQTLVYVDTVELCALVAANAERTSALQVQLADYEFGLDTSLPADMMRACATPVLMKKLLCFFCRILVENTDEILQKDPTHQIIVDGMRHYSGGCISLPAESLGIWRSSTRVIDAAKNSVGEGDAKATYWATRYFKDESVLVHINDSDIVAMLVLYSARVNHANLITGVMSTHYLFPVREGKKQTVSSNGSKEEKKKLFNSMLLATGIYDSINATSETSVILPQTYLLFLLMCGNDFVEQLRGIGPAKFGSALLARRTGLLDRAVTFRENDTRIDIEVDEKAILDTLAESLGALLAENELTPAYMAAWLRRVTWALDYATNSSMDGSFLDPFARREGLSLHGYKLDEAGKCVLDNDVWNPTLVNFTVPSQRVQKRLHVTFDPDGDKRPAKKGVAVEQKEATVAAGVSFDNAVQSLGKPFPAHQASNMGESRRRYLSELRDPVPFRVSIEKEQ